MRITYAALENFASYESLEFDFKNQGLTLIGGATGSGKSTLCDAVPWVLFGRTAKGGMVDEILSWPGDKISTGTVYLDIGTITRQRGPKAKDNDLYFHPAGAVTPTRGKDIPDTQRMINNFVGMDYDLYLAGAYFHEFSQTAQFFSTTAKNRRLICEQLVDLTLAKTLQDKVSAAKKLTDKRQIDILNGKTKTEAQLATLIRVQEQEKGKAERWSLQHVGKRLMLEQNVIRWEADRSKRILALELELTKPLKDKKCPSCGTVLGKAAACNVEKVQIEQEKDRLNPYINDITNLDFEVNPYGDTVTDYSKEIKGLEQALLDIQTQFENCCEELDDLAVLQDVTQLYRSTSIGNTITLLESKTNQLLADYFDGEIKVNFEVEASDKLDVTIYKDGNVASYTQLSKGQRQLLKLCFGVAVMEAVQNHHGITLSQVFLDEATDGLDELMKTKAYRLLETLAQSYESVFLVEHSDVLKNMFINKYNVELVNGISEISKC